MQRKVDDATALSIRTSAPAARSEYLPASALAKGMGPYRELFDMARGPPTIALGRLPSVKSRRRNASVIRNFPASSIAIELGPRARAEMQYLSEP